jgi:hypothetical protein
MEGFSFGFTEGFSLGFSKRLLEGYSPGSGKDFSFQLKQVIVGRNWHSITCQQRTEGRILSRLCHTVLFLLKHSIAGRFWQLITKNQALNYLCTSHLLLRLIIESFTILLHHEFATQKSGCLFAEIIGSVCILGGIFAQVLMRVLGRIFTRVLGRIFT